MGTVTVAAAAVVAAAAARRAEEAGCSLGAGLRLVVGDWAPSAVRRRVRLALLDGSRAMALRERVARRQLAALGVATY